METQTWKQPKDRVVFQGEIIQEECTRWEKKRAVDGFLVVKMRHTRGLTSV